jgi:hypothetical protein
MAFQTTEQERGTFVIHTLRGMPTNTEVSLFVESEARRLQRAGLAGTKLVFLVDLTDAEPLTSEQRKKVAGFTRDYSDVVRRHVAAMVFVVPNIVIRGSLMSIFFIRRPAARVEICASLADGNKVATALHKSVARVSAPNVAAVSGTKPIMPSGGRA